MRKRAAMLVACFALGACAAPLDEDTASSTSAEDALSGDNGFAKARSKMEEIRGDLASNQAHLRGVHFGQHQKLRRDFDAERGPESASVEFPMAFLEALGEVFTEVFNQGELAVFDVAARRFNVDIPVAHDMPPGSPQHLYILPVAYSQVPMPGAALLFLCDRHIHPARQPAFYDPDEFGEVITGEVEIGDVLAVGQRQ